MFRERISLGTFAAALLIGAATSTHAASYAVTDLGDLPGGIELSIGYGLNDAGQAVGESSGSPSTRAFFWSDTGGLQDIGDLPGGSNLADARAINNAGQVTGTSGAASGSHAFVWTGAGGMQDIGTVAGHAFSRGNGINDLGQVVGQSGTLGAGQIAHAFLWSASGGMRDLGDLAGGNEIASANDINELGQVVGVGSTAGGQRGFLWTEATGMQALSTLAGGSRAQANAINNFGQIVGASGSGSSIGRAVLWDSSGSIFDLGTLGGNTATANGINDAGFVVGIADTATAGAAYMWSSATGMQDLNTLIDPASGWRLFEALDINAAGQIVGYGSRGGQLHAFLLTPDAAVPEPATWAMMIAGFGLVGGAMRQRKPQSIKEYHHA